MYLKYGNYQHEANECAVVISKDAEVSASGKVMYVHERWDVQGRIQAATQAAVVAALIALENAYNYDGYDIALYGESGCTHYLPSSDCLHGTIVTRRPSYPQGDGAEFSTFRTYALAVEGKRKRTDVLLLSFRESINWMGTGGKNWGYLVPLTGQPVPQTFTESSLVTIVQEGYAVGYNGYPLASLPLWPSNELETERSISMEVPETGSIERRTSWRFVFLAPIKLVGVPRS